MHLSVAIANLQLKSMERLLNNYPKDRINTKISHASAPSVTSPVLRVANTTTHKSNTQNVQRMLQQKSVKHQTQITYSPGTILLFPVSLLRFL
jgi:hypothetical protein